MIFLKISPAKECLNVYNIIKYERWIYVDRFDVINDRVRVNRGTAAGHARLFSTLPEEARGMLENCFRFRLLPGPGTGPTLNPKSRRIKI